VARKDSEVINSGREFGCLLVAGKKISPLQSGSHLRGKGKIEWFRKKGGSAVNHLSGINLTEGGARGRKKHILGKKKKKKILADDQMKKKKIQLARKDLEKRIRRPLGVYNERKTIVIPTKMG